MEELIPDPKITIAEIRFKNGRMTQKEFADSIGVSTQTVVAWEKDVFKVSPKYLVKIFQVYGVSSSDLLGA